MEITWEDLRTLERLVLKCVLTGWEGVSWIQLAQDGDKWRAVVNAVMNLCVI